ncbi:transcription antitermination factor NusG [Rubricella aquisinus]|uniref:Transcription antitermination factor NusG n=1 Tax=Rubricella aquisinus TaxID=2028108 RepID=A0A840WQ34_9RHOB|nr:transcription termination/antitermination NusG family protein [Rubricella aquisinus]MBB5515782.1 transcription antitermination factor NusG [Rubricella aquisinus]
MSMMGEITAQDMQWFACRVKRKQVGGIKTIRIGGEFETFRDRQGRMRKRRVDGTGKAVFLPEHLLRRAGFEVFLPVKKVLRRKNRFTPEKALVAQPLLVDWLFVGWPIGGSRWDHLMDLDVVTGVMGTGGRPVEIPSARVMQLMRQWGGGMLSPECERYLKSGVEFKPNDLVRVIAGPLDGVRLRVVDVSGPTVKAALDILGGEICAQIRSDLLIADTPDGGK